MAQPSGSAAIIDGVIYARIGLCEDDADLRSVLTRALRGEDFEVRATMTGHEAVEVFSASAPDLLVLDIGLPDADGRGTSVRRCVRTASWRRSFF